MLQSYKSIFPHEKSILETYRVLGQWVMGVLALNMLAQLCIVAWQVLSSFDQYLQFWGLLLSSCHFIWIITSGVGSIAAFYSSWHHDIPTAKYCLRMWILLIALQIAQWILMTCMSIAQEVHWSNSTGALAWQSFLLIGIESIFVAFVHGYIQLLIAYNHVESSSEGICLVDMNSKSDIELQNIHPTNYGTAV